MLAMNVVSPSLVLLGSVFETALRRVRSPLGVEEPAGCTGGDDRDRDPRSRRCVHHPRSRRRRSSELRAGRRVARLPSLVSSVGLVVLVGALVAGAAVVSVGGLPGGARAAARAPRSEPRRAAGAPSSRRWNRHSPRCRHPRYRQLPAGWSAGAVGVGVEAAKLTGTEPP